jgi:lipoate-protein ligase A
MSVRWLPPLRLGGAWQMAIDSWLLERAVEGAAPMLRFYAWRRPTLSIGFHQRRLPAHWLRYACNGAVELVRRPSGGRAVLHAGELTYALVWPQAPQRRSEAYEQACGWLRMAFEELGQPLGFGRQAAGTERSSCFATSTAADLVHADGAKRIGSAQLWRAGCLLQHGSILLKPPAPLWRELLGHEPPPLPPLPLEGSALVAHLRRAAERHLAPLRSSEVREQPLTRAERQAIRSRLDRYRLAPEAWGASGANAPAGTSPAATMPRAT